MKHIKPYTSNKLDELSVYLKDIFDKYTLVNTTTSRIKRHIMPSWYISKNQDYLHISPRNRDETIKLKEDIRNSKSDIEKKLGCIISISSDPWNIDIFIK